MKDKEEKREEAKVEENRLEEAKEGEKRDKQAPTKEKMDVAQDEQEQNKDLKEKESTPDRAISQTKILETNENNEKLQSEGGEQNSSDDDRQKNDESRYESPKAEERETSDWSLSLSGSGGWSSPERKAKPLGNPNWEPSDNRRYPRGRDYMFDQQFSRTRFRPRYESRGSHQVRSLVSRPTDRSRSKSRNRSRKEQESGPSRDEDRRSIPLKHSPEKKPRDLPSRRNDDDETPSGRVVSSQVTRRDPSPEEKSKHKKKKKKKDHEDKPKKKGSHSRRTSSE